MIDNQIDNQIDNEDTDEPPGTGRGLCKLRDIRGVAMFPVGLFNRYGGLAARRACHGFVLCGWEFEHETMVESI